jgi:adenosylmethionine-8-amino-7-oxononanoate aminotransferase
VRALAAQAATVGQVLDASFAHEPGARLAAELARRAPGGPDALPRVFYSDDGSTAVEVAIKIAYQAFRNRGDHRRRRLVAFDGAYHGDTFGAMSAGGDGVFHAAFKELLFEVEHVAVPGWPSSAPTLDAVLDAHGDEVFAVIVEPLLQGAAGMRTYAPEFLAHVRARTAALGVPLIADEVFTGFGRTGAMFACTRAGVVPDLLCLSKALTAGMLPMGATLASQALFDAFWSDDRRHTLFHGHSFTGNPLACAVALEGLAIFDDEDVLGHVARLEAAARPRLDALAKHPRVAAARGLGAVWAVDLRTDGDGSYLDPIGQRVARRMLERGVFVRPMGPVVYLVASSAMSVGEVGRFFDALEAALDEG